MKENNKQISIIEVNGVKDFYVCGDIHGGFAELVVNLERYNIQDSAIIVLGDCGIGFENPGHYQHIYKKKLEKKLDKYNNIILCIRGNHDDPRFYDNPEFIPDLPRVKTLPSNTILNILGYNVLGIHGECKNLENAIKDFSKTYGVDISFLIGGHKHHQNSSNIGIESDVIGVPSVIGIDDYSLSLHKTSDPGATLFVLEDGKGKTMEYNIKL